MSRFSLDVYETPIEGGDYLGILTEHDLQQEQEVEQQEQGVEQQQETHHNNAHDGSTITTYPLRTNRWENASLIFVIDSSASMGGHFASLFTKVLPLLFQRLGLPPDFVVKLILFGAETKEFTTTVQRVAFFPTNQIQQGGTYLTLPHHNVFDKLFTAIEQIPADHVLQIIVLSDGLIADISDSVKAAAALYQKVRPLTWQRGIATHVAAIRYITGKEQPDTRGLTCFLSLNTVATPVDSKGEDGGDWLTTEQRATRQNHAENLITMDARVVNHNDQAVMIADACKAFNFSTISAFFSAPLNKTTTEEKMFQLEPWTAQQSYMQTAYLKSIAADKKLVESVPHPQATCTKQQPLAQHSKSTLLWLSRFKIDALIKTHAETQHRQKPHDRPYVAPEAFNIFFVVKKHSVEDTTSHLITVAEHRIRPTFHFIQEQEVELLPNLFEQDNIIDDEEDKEGSEQQKQQEQQLAQDGADKNSKIVKKKLCALTPTLFVNVIAPYVQYYTRQAKVLKFLDPSVHYHVDVMLRFFEKIETAVLQAVSYQQLQHDPTSIDSIIQNNPNLSRTQHRMLQLTNKVVLLNKTVSHQLKQFANVNLVEVFNNAQSQADFLNSNLSTTKKCVQNLVKRHLKQNTLDFDLICRRQAVALVRHLELFEEQFARELDKIGKTEEQILPPSFVSLDTTLESLRNLRALYLTLISGKRLPNIAAYDAGHNFGKSILENLTALEILEFVNITGLPMQVNLKEYTDPFTLDIITTYTGGYSLGVGDLISCYNTSQTQYQMRVAEWKKEYEAYRVRFKRRMALYDKNVALAQNKDISKKAKNNKNDDSAPWLDHIHQEGALFLFNSFDDHNPHAASNPMDQPDVTRPWQLPPVKPTHEHASRIHFPGCAEGHGVVNAVLPLFNHPLLYHFFMQYAPDLFSYYCSVSIRRVIAHIPETYVAMLSAVFLKVMLQCNAMPTKQNLEVLNMLYNNIYYTTTLLTPDRFLVKGNHVPDIIEDFSDSDSDDDDEKDGDNRDVIIQDPEEAVQNKKKSHHKLLDTTHKTSTLFYFRPFFDSIFHAVMSCYVQDQYMLNPAHNSHTKTKDAQSHLPPIPYRLSQLVYPLITLYNACETGYNTELVQFYDWVYQRHLQHQKAMTKNPQTAVVHLVGETAVNINQHVNPTWLPKVFKLPPIAVLKQYLPTVLRALYLHEVFCNYRYTYRNQANATAIIHNTLYSLVLGQLYHPSTKNSIIQQYIPYQFANKDGETNTTTTTTTIDKYQDMPEHELMEQELWDNRLDDVNYFTRNGYKHLIRYLHEDQKYKAKQIKKQNNKNGTDATTEVYNNNATILNKILSCNDPMYNISKHYVDVSVPEYNELNIIFTLPNYANTLVNFAKQHAVLAEDARFTISVPPSSILPEYHYDRKSFHTQSGGVEIAYLPPDFTPETSLYHQKKIQSLQNHTNNTTTPTKSTQIAIKNLHNELQLPLRVIQTLENTEQHAEFFDMLFIALHYYHSTNCSAAFLRRLKWTHILFDPTKRYLFNKYRQTNVLYQTLWPLLEASKYQPHDADDFVNTVIPHSQTPFYGFFTDYVLTHTPRYGGWKKTMDWNIPDLSLIMLKHPYGRHFTHNHEMVQYYNRHMAANQSVEERDVQQLQNFFLNFSHYFCYWSYMKLQNLVWSYTTDDWYTPEELAEKKEAEAEQKRREEEKKAEEKKQQQAIREQGVLYRTQKEKDKAEAEKKKTQPVYRDGEVDDNGMVTFRLSNQTTVRCTKMEAWGGFTPLDYSEVYEGVLLRYTTKYESMMTRTYHNSAELFQKNCFASDGDYYDVNGLDKQTLGYSNHMLYLYKYIGLIYSLQYTTLSDRVEFFDYFSMNNIGKNVTQDANLLPPHATTTTPTAKDKKSKNKLKSKKAKGGAQFDTSTIVDSKEEKHRQKMLLAMQQDPVLYDQKADTFTLYRCYLSKLLDIPTPQQLLVQLTALQNDNKRILEKKQQKSELKQLQMAAKLEAQIGLLVEPQHIILPDSDLTELQITNFHTPLLVNTMLDLLKTILRNATLLFYIREIIEPRLFSRHGQRQQLLMRMYVKKLYLSSTYEEYLNLLENGIVVYHHCQDDDVSNETKKHKKPSSSASTSITSPTQIDQKTTSPPVVLEDFSTWGFGSDQAAKESSPTPPSSSPLLSAKSTSTKTPQKKKIKYSFLFNNHFALGCAEFWNMLGLNDIAQLTGFTPKPSDDAQLVPIDTPGVTAQNRQDFITLRQKKIFTFLLGKDYFVPQPPNGTETTLTSEKIVWNNGNVFAPGQPANLVYVSRWFYDSTTLSQNNLWTRDLMVKLAARREHNYRGGADARNRHGHHNNLKSYWALGYPTLLAFKLDVGDEIFERYARDHTNCCGFKVYPTKK